MTEHGHIPEEDLVIFAMQGLPEEQSAEIATHVADCPECRQALAELLGDLALIGLSVEQHPLPEGAKARFEARLNAGAQPLAPIRQFPAQEPPTSVPGAPRRRGPGFWIPWATAAAMTIAVISLAIQNFELSDQLRDESQLVTNLAGKASRAQQLSEVLTSPSAQRVILTPGKPPDEPVARAIYLADLGSLVFEAANLKPLPPDKTYELWIIPADGKAPIAAGLFQPDAKGVASVVLPKIPTGVAAKAFGVTEEKAGGSSTPTLPILLSGSTT